MPRNVGRFSWLLLSLPGAWAALIIEVPPSPVQAAPRSDAYLPCYFAVDPPRPINLDFLVVKWTLRGRIVAKFDTSIASFRPRGAVLDSMQLRQGNATLFLLDVRDEDAGEYKCFVIHTPDSAEGKVALKIEARPRLTLRPTNVQLGKPSNVTCAASDFYSGNISVSWLRDGETLKVDTPPVHRGLDGLFYAESVLEFTPQISDADVTFSCHIHHQAAEDPISQNFKLHLQARPDLHVLTRPEGKAFLVAECLVCGFYPQNLKLQWLQNGVPMPHRIYKSDLVQNPNGTFSMQSLILPQQSDAAASYTCQVQHEAMEEPLEKTVPWQPGAALTIEVPPSPVQAAPRSDAYLPCYFAVDPPRPINLDFLVVKWTLRGRIVAKFDTSIASFRPRGAVLDSMQLRQGNATLFLLDVRDEDAGEYKCFVIHTSDSAEGKVALKIEARPRLTLGLTNVQLGKPSKMTCAASNFYPGNLSVSWLQDGETLKVGTPPVQRRLNGLFYAESVLEFTPKISDADVTFSCRIHHQAAKDPISQDFELHLQVPGFWASQMGWLLGIFGFLLGLGLGAGAMILYYRKRVGKYEEAVQIDETLLEKMDKDDKGQEGKAI